MRIGTLELGTPLALAPMDDISDFPFRTLCREHGADLVYTEFANSEALIRNVKKVFQRIVVSPAERPAGVQIYGCIEESMERAAVTAESVEPDFIDINCGCWVKKIAMRGDGAGLLRDLDKFEAVVKAVVRASHIPVTVKTRLGWDANSIVILDVARMLEQSGVQALTVHCRTREQGYSGTADWSWLERVKSVATIPLIGNGDVKCADDVRRMLGTGCDGVMIGRAAVGNPWIFKQAKHFLATGEHLPEPDVHDRVTTCLDHLARAVAYRGERSGVVTFRKNYSGYFRGLPYVAKLRADLMRSECYAEVETHLRRFEEAEGMKSEV